MKKLYMVELNSQGAPNFSTAVEQPYHKTGKWLPDNNNYITPHFVCSACEMSQKVETVMYKPIWAYCPRCGARMMEGEQE